MELKKLNSAISYVRKNSKNFLRTGKVDLNELATNVLYDALALGAETGGVCKLGEWWIVYADFDWLVTEDEKTITTMFNSIVALPEAGPNSCRSEVLLNAFCENVIVFGSDDNEIIRGVGDKMLSDFVFKNLGGKRAVAFCGVGKTIGHALKKGKQ